MGCFDLNNAEDGRDRFFLYAMIIVPFISSGCYVFDAWHHYVYHPDSRNYEGLMSTIVIVFIYLQYCAPIQSRRLLAIYHILLWIITEIANLGYLIFYIQKGETFRIIIYFAFLILQIYLTIGLLYCRVLNNFESNIVVENKHVFHFMSRLEVILTIYIPAYWKVKYTSLTRHTIAYFLLFDFFADSYHRFQGVWIKSALYLFVTTVTVAVATEWIYLNHEDPIYKTISLIAEVISAFLCNTIIILQFFPFHFKTQHIQHIAREALIVFRKQQDAIQGKAESSTKISMMSELKS
ncbi:unnamed protein product [Rotaria sp. Silwood1]|nr:unnamed protein product [Rotaria sp. Silwood1]CAF3825435.1 unnamed protein product [Rotaria sp. Silwood1]